ncbi:MAG TPA: hypothetical protein VJM31_10695 [Vicinamibacterales bacterium]|nr:hypothetical protein [Vicinamibacterales bacterium]
MHKQRSMLLAVLAWVAGVSPAFAESATLFRVFLNDGTAVVSYGEYARVGDRLVFSMPLGAVDIAKGGPDLHVVNLPVSAVNWTATARYADSARFSHYMATSAESDYAALAGEVAAALNAIVLARDPKVRLNMAVDARRRLATWPRDHYGYRADDMREMLGLLDEAISGLRAAAGATSFALDLVAIAPTVVGPRDDVPLLPAPTAAEAIAQAVAIAKASDVAADRVSILRGVLTALDKSRYELPSHMAASIRTWALQTIKAEAQVEQQYAALTSSLSKRASDAAGRGDVRTIEQVLETAVRRDTQLGRRRPEEINALLGQVQAQLDAARRLRLARDQWHERAGSHRAYTRIVAPIIDGLVRAQRHLDDIKRLAGSEARVLVALSDLFATNLKSLGVVAVPDELKPAHALLISAFNLAETAVRTRRQATVSGQLTLAWDASSAAAGSMMLLIRAQEDMEAVVRLPQIR